VPPLLTHRITDFQNVDSGTLHCPESDNGYWRGTKDVKFRDFSFDAVDNLPSRGDDILCRFVVTASDELGSAGQVWKEKIPHTSRPYIA